MKPGVALRGSSIELYLYSQEQPLTEFTTFTEAFTFFHFIYVIEINKIKNAAFTLNGENERQMIVFCYIFWKQKSFETWILLLYKFCKLS